MAALTQLGGDATSTRVFLRESYYRLAKQVHPDVVGGDRKLAMLSFAKLAAAWSLLSDHNPAAKEEQVEVVIVEVDPLEAWFAVEEERRDAMHAEILEAAKLSQGGLDTGGLWQMAASLVAHDARQDDDDGPAKKRTPAAKRNSDR